MDLRSIVMKKDHPERFGKGEYDSVLYLFFYNLVSSFFWFCILFMIGMKIYLNRLESTYDMIHEFLKVTQTMAVCEIWHVYMKIVKTPLITTIMQVFSRVWTVWAVMHIAPPAQTSIFFIMAATSWCLVEVPRYLFYALNIMDEVPYWLFWMRYSLFAVLYPTGITGELGCMYLAAQYLMENPELYVFTPFPVQYPELQVKLLHLIIFVVLTYIPGYRSPKMYLHMVATRKKQFALWKKNAAEKKAWMEHVKHTHLADKPKED